MFFIKRVTPWKPQADARPYKNTEWILLFKLADDKLVLVNHFESYREARANLKEKSANQPRYPVYTNNNSWNDLFLDHLKTQGLNVFH